NPRNTTILRNAAWFLAHHDGLLSESLVRQAQSVDPNNPEWGWMLGHVCALNLRSAPVEQRRELAGKPLAELQSSMMRVREGTQQLPILLFLPKAAFAAGEFGKARDFATKLLDKIEQGGYFKSFGDGVHSANLVLGRLALRDGQLDKAKEHLLAAGKTAGTPVLNPFGPDMTLPTELLEL